MHVIDDLTMQELLRFVKAHHTFARHNRVFRERILEMMVILREMEAIRLRLEGLLDREIEITLPRTLAAHEARLTTLENQRHRAPQGKAHPGKEA